jgi:hypothetical protein
VGSLVGRTSPASPVGSLIGQTSPTVASFPSLVGPSVPTPAPGSNVVSVAPVTSLVSQLARELAAPVIGSWASGLSASSISTAAAALGLSHGGSGFGCGAGCGVADLTPASAPGPVPQAPSAPSGGAGAAGGVGSSGGHFFFVFGVLFVAMGLSLPGLMRRRSERVLGRPTPFLAVSVSPD